jgi:hypothetical protein
MIDPNDVLGYLLKLGAGPERVLLARARLEEEAASLLGIEVEDLTALPTSRGILYASKSAQLARVEAINVPVSKATEKLFGTAVPLRGTVLSVQRPQPIEQE